MPTTKQVTLDVTELDHVTPTGARTQRAITPDTRPVRPVRTRMPRDRSVVALVATYLQDNPHASLRRAERALHRDRRTVTNAANIAGIKRLSRLERVAGRKWPRRFTTWVQRSTPFAGPVTLVTLFVTPSALSARSKSYRVTRMMTRKRKSVSAGAHVTPSCSECGQAVTGYANKLTCSDACRQHRSRRLNHPAVAQPQTPVTSAAGEAVTATTVERVVVASKLPVTVAHGLSPATTPMNATGPPITTKAELSAAEAAREEAKEADFLERCGPEIARREAGIGLIAGGGSLPSGARQSYTTTGEVVAA